MKFDNEILKDLIIERDLLHHTADFDLDGKTVKRENIIFENVYKNNGYILAPYRELIWSRDFSVKVEEYLSKIKQKERNNKLNNLGI